MWEQFFWTLFRDSKHAIALFDDVVIVDVNPASCKMLGGSREQIVGLTLDELTPPAEREERRRVFWEAGEWDRQLDLLRLDGTAVRVQQAARGGEIDGRRLGVAVSIELPSEDTPFLPGRLGALTPREREIVERVSLGETTPEIAETLVISGETVRTHVRNAMAKTGAHTRAQLVAIALAERRIGPVS
jgi:PAS domain S-box-containing protein